MSDDDIPLTGKIKNKLIATKEQWAREGRGLTGRPPDSNQPRLPPGQRLVRDWPVLDLGIQPDVSPKTWAFSVGGLVENAIEWDWDAFMAQPQVTLTTDIHCVTTWSMYDNQWVGVSALHLLSVVKPKPEAKFVVMHSYDGYTTNVPLAALADDDVVLAHTWQGKPITREHGGPMRAIIPKLYLWKSAKWLRHITFLAKDAPGYWEVRGYHNNGDPWTEERYG